MKERRLILHLGGFKTGTTTLQRTLFASRGRLAERGVVYPDFASNHGLALYPLLAGLDDRIARHPYGGIWTGVAARRANDCIEVAFEDILEAVEDGTTTILSGEHFSALSGDAVARFVDWLRDYFTEIQGVLTLRSPVSFTTSMAQQLIRDGARLSDVDAAPVLPQYRDSIEPWDAALGPDSIRLQCFDPETDPVNQFLQAIERPDLLGVMKRPEKGMTANRAVSSRAVALLDRINTVFPGGHTNPRRAVRVSDFAARCHGPRFLLRPETAEKVRSETREDLEWLSHRLGHAAFDEETYTEPAVAAPCPEGALERLGRRMNDVALRRQTAVGRWRIRNALETNEQDSAWEGIALLAEEGLALEAGTAFAARGWSALSRAAADQALRLAPEDPRALIALGISGCETG